MEIDAAVKLTEAGLADDLSPWLNCLLSDRLKEKIRLDIQDNRFYQLSQID